MKKLELLYKIEETLLASSICIIALVLIGNVLSRIFTGYTWYFAEEVCQTMVIFSSFMGLAYVARNNKHISMSAIVDMLPKKIKIIFANIIDITTALVCFYMSYLSVLYTIRVTELGRVTPALQLPYYVNTSTVALGLFLCGVTYIIKFLENVSDIKE